MSSICLHYLCQFEIVQFGAYKWTVCAQERQTTFSTYTLTNIQSQPPRLDILQEIILFYNKLSTCISSVSTGLFAAFAFSFPTEKLGFSVVARSTAPATVLEILTSIYVFTQRWRFDTDPSINGGT